MSQKINVVKTVLLGILLGTLIYFANYELAVFLMVSALFLYVIFNKIRFPEELNNRSIYMILLIAILIRLGLIALDYFYPLPMNDWDVGSFLRLANEILVQHFPPINQLSEGGVTAYYGYFLAVVFMFLGISKWVGMLVNVALGLLFSYNIFRITRLLYNKEAAKVAFVISLFIPSYLLLSVALIRDLLIVFAISEILYLGFKYFQSKNIKHLLWSIPFSLILFFLRIEQLGMLIIALGFVFALFHIKTKKIFIAVSILGLIALMFSPVFLSVLEKLDTMHESRNRGRTAYLGGAEFDTLPNYMKNIPLGAIYGLYSPLPHQFTNAKKELIPMIEGLFFLLITGLGILYSNQLLKKANKNAYYGALVMLLYFIIYIAIYGAADTNIGTAYRHRMQATFIILIFAAPILQKYWEQIKRVCNNKTQVFNAEDSKRKTIK